MDLKNYITNEKIKKKFVSQFDLVNYAIRLAGNMVATGREPRVKIDSQNRALQILSEILQGQDVFDDIASPVDAKAVPHVEQEPVTKAPERKKSRSSNL